MFIVYLYLRRRLMAAFRLETANSTFLVSFSIVSALTSDSMSKHKASTALNSHLGIGNFWETLQRTALHSIDTSLDL